MNRTRNLILSILLFALGMALFFTAQLSVVGGSFMSGSIFSYSFPLRALFCCLAIACIAAASFVWKAKRRWGNAVKFLLALFVILFIAVLGFNDNRIAAAVLTAAQS